MLFLCKLFFAVSRLLWFHKYNKYSNLVFRFFSFFNSCLFNFLLHVLYTHTVKMQQPLSTFQPNLMKKEMPSTKNATIYIYNFSFQTKKAAENKTMENFNRRTEHTEQKSIFHSNVLIMFPARDSILFVHILCHALFYAFQFSAQCTQVVICVCSNSLRFFFSKFQWKLNISSIFIFQYIILLFTTIPSRKKTIFH